METPRTVSVALPDTTLAGLHWAGDPARHLVLLHPGVADSRCWHRVAGELTDLGLVWAYDRPGFGSSAPAGDPDGDGVRPARDHVADALAFLDATAGPDTPVWLVGGSMGGAVALDVAVSHPDRVVGLVLIGAGATGDGLPRTEPTEQEKAIYTAGDEAYDRGDLDESNRYEIWYWLDGPAQPEGRVVGPERELAFEMNRIALGQPQEGMDQQVTASTRLGELRVPVAVTVGEYDEVDTVGLAHGLAAGISGATFDLLPGTAHLPYLDAPDTVVGVIRRTVEASQDTGAEPIGAEQS